MFRGMFSELILAINQAGWVMSGEALVSFLLLKARVIKKIFVFLHIDSMCSSIGLNVPGIESQVRPLQFPIVIIELPMDSTPFTLCLRLLNEVSHVAGQPTFQPSFWRPTK